MRFLTNRVAVDVFVLYRAQRLHINLSRHLSNSSYDFTLVHRYTPYTICRAGGQTRLCLADGQGGISFAVKSPGFLFFGSLRDLAVMTAIVALV